MSTPSALSRSDLGYTAALAAAAILSTTAILIRHLTVAHGLPPLVLAFWRNVFVVATLAPALALLCRRRLGRRIRDLPFLAAYGLLLAVFNALWTLSVARIGASLATVLVYTSGAATALLGAAFLGERLDRFKGAAVVACVGGCALVAAPSGGEWRTDSVGLAAGLLSGLAYAGYSLLGRVASRRGLDPWNTVLHAFGFGAVFLLAGLALSPALVPGAAGAGDLLVLGRAWAGWGALLLLAAGPTVVGFGLYGVSLSLLPASVANLVLTLEPALTALIAWAWLGERLARAEIAGAGLILLGVAVLRLGERSREGEGPISSPGLDGRGGSPAVRTRR